MTRLAPHRARRKIGFWMTTSLVVGNIIGSAIFMLPAGLAPFGWNAVSAWAVTFVGALSLAWMYAALARHLPNVGGSIGFMAVGVSETAAFIGGWGYAVSVWSANAGITIAGISYLARLVPWIGTTSWSAPLSALVLLWLFAGLNLRGLRMAGSVQTITTVLKLLPFVAVISIAVWRIGLHGVAALPPVAASSFTLAGTTGAVGLTLFALLGLESAVIPTDAVENAERNVPRATMIGTGLSAVVTLVASCAVALMLATAATSEAPVADFAATAFGSNAGILIAVGAVISCFGCLNGWLLVSGELPVAMAERGTLPPWFGRVNSYGAPTGNIILGTLITSALILLAYTKTGVAAYNFVILLSTAATLVLYAICVWAAARLIRDGRLPSRWLLKGALFLACGFVLLAFYSAGIESMLWTLALMAAGWPVYRVACRATSRAAASGA